MTDWRAAGRLADAHRVTALARGEYGSPAKVAARSAAVAFLAAYANGTVLDMWGGGASADALALAGCDVLSVENGRWMKAALGVSRARALRAHRQAGEEGGYRTEWGPANRFALGCAGAYLDFCGHWSSDVRSTLKAARHMDAIVITLMPERVAVGRGLTPDEWRLIYASLLKHSLPDHHLRMFRRYRRRGGQWAFIFGLAAKHIRGSGRRQSTDPDAKRIAMQIRYAGDPEYRQRCKEAGVRYRLAMSDEQRARVVARHASNRWKRRCASEDVAQ